jgi:hypothetical protein
VVLVKERLDRAVASPNWCGFFLDAMVEVLPVSYSNHNPLWLQFTSPIFFCSETIQV